MKTCVNASWPLEFSILSRGTQPETKFFFFCTPTFKLVPAPLEGGEGLQALACMQRAHTHALL